MLLNSQNLFFKSNSQITKQNQALVQQVTNSQNSNSTNSEFKKPRLSAKWHKENGKMVCNWIVN
ncbi:MAG: hypothetical protein KME30_11090 [Iphinoe sp. HA4291-MV1]|jgi:hypothetical protein|nr:hypothetical protein [Iphinoe sp. HA4291-MV1]